MRKLRSTATGSRRRAAAGTLVLCVALAAAGLAGVTAFGATAPPTNTSPPQVVGEAREGMQLTATQGSWDEDPTSFAYQWERCPGDETTCADIPGATGSLYTPVEDDVGERLRVGVVATNEIGPSAEEFSALTDAVADATPPGNAVPPQVLGTAPPEVGDELTADPGTWTGMPAPTLAYRWLGCTSADPADCSPIAGATGTTYTPVAADLGKRLRVEVTGTNVDDTASATSDPTQPVVESTRPVNTVLPAITGVLTVGQTLSTTTGVWTTVAPPLAFSQQWQRCDDQGQACVDIGGATQPTYELQGADAGHTVVAVVTAQDNAGKSTAAKSNPTGVVGQGPVNTAPPTISGNPMLGQTLTAAVGTWQDQNALAFTYRWQRCNAQGQACQNIPGATDRTYQPTSADLGSRIVVVVTARDASNATQNATSAPTQVVAGVPAGQTLAVSDVFLPERLIVSDFEFVPAILRSRDPFTARFRVTDTQGHPISGADVYLVAIPYGRIAPPGTARTDATGWATFRLQPTHRFPLVKGYLITIFARATKPGDDLLAGVSARRLVSVRINPSR